MDPFYKNMHSSPNQNDQIQYRPYYYPATEAIPAQMYVNPPRPSVRYGCWPMGCNYGCGYPYPVVCHGCCNHAHMPTHYAWGSPYSHVPPPHCHGSYSVPVPHMPPPFHGMEQPRYEYEKNVQRDHHCCGCPNHPSHQREQKNVRIEEEEPERERRKDDSVVPFKFKKKLYPTVWLPPDYSNNQEHGKPNNSEDQKEEKPYDSRKSVEQQPAFWNGWYPLDLNNLILSKQMGERDGNHHQQDEGKGHFPFPSLWIPYKPEGEESKEHRANDANTKLSLELENGSGGEQKLHLNGENIGGQAASRAKDIPVKEVVKQEEKEMPENKEEERDLPLKDGIDNEEKKIDNGEKKIPKDGAKRKSPSPPKSPKLPPVCLRVDPLPRRKGTNGKSRSPSPPGEKQRPGQLSKETSKALSSSDKKKPEKITNDELKARKGITKTIDVVDGKTQQEKSMNVNMETSLNLPVNSHKDVSKTRTEGKPNEENVSHENVKTDAKTVIKGQSDAASARGKNEESLKTKEAREDEAKESPKTKLSEEEAAVIIQSAYRGFDIWRWEPIKKLKQIAKVREQIAEVKNLIQAVESSSDIQGNSKQRNIIAETIMSLLLKLDTIQGLHPSIREVRKSVVRELVGFQEKLDLLMNKKSEASPGQESIMRHDEDAPKETEDVISSQNGSETPPESLESHHNQLDRGSNHENLEISETNLIEKHRSAKLEKEAAESCTTEGSESASQPVIENAEEKSNEGHENDETSIAKEDKGDRLLGQGSELSSLQNNSSEVAAKEDHGDLVLGQSSELSSLQNNASETAKDFASTDHGNLESELAELPHGIFDDIYAYKNTNHSAVDADTSKAGQAKQLEDGLMEAPIALEFHNGAADEENKEKVEYHELEDLPFSGVEIESEAEETSPINGSLNNCEVDDKFGVEEADNKTENAIFDPNEYAAERPQNTSEPSEASDEREIPIADAGNEKHATCNISDEVSRVSVEISEAPLEVPLENEMSGQVSQECTSEQEERLVESANSYETAVMMGVKDAAEDKYEDIKGHEEVFGEAEPQMMEAREAGNEGTVDKHPVEVLSEESQEHNLEAQSFKNASADEENAAKDVNVVSQVDPTPTQTSAARDELEESNRKLIQENERLRNMMEKLLQSGQEQLTAISGLSGRVKDLEKRLSRKRKLKMKHYRAPR